VKVNKSRRKYCYKPEVFHSRNQGHFHVNLIAHILEYFGLDDVEFFISELFSGFCNIISSRRDVQSISQIYFSNVIQLRASIFYQAFAIDRKKMTAAGIAIKYGVSYREVHRGLRSIGYQQTGGFGRRVKFRGCYED